MPINTVTLDQERLRRSGIHDTSDVRYISIPGYSDYFLRLKGEDWAHVELISKSGRRHTYGRVNGRLYSKAGQGRIRYHVSPDGPDWPVRPARGYLVLLATQGPPHRPGMLTRHLNDIATDDRPTNLVWGTPLENVRDADAHGRQTKPEAALAWRALVASRRTGVAA